MRILLTLTRLPPDNLPSCCSRRAKVLLVAESKWKTLQKAKTQGMHIYTSVSQYLLKGELVDMIESTKVGVQRRAWNHGASTGLSRRMDELRKSTFNPTGEFI